MTRLNRTNNQKLRPLQHSQLENRPAWVEAACATESNHTDELVNEMNNVNRKSDFGATNIVSSDEPAARCSYCGHPYLRSQSKSVPFCSVRCQQIDLGLWLDERLGLPMEGHEEQEFTGFEEDDS